jgi:hypothetical protein
LCVKCLQVPHILSSRLSSRRDKGFLQAMNAYPVARCASHPDKVPPSPSHHSAGLVEVLAGGLREDDLEVQRRSAAALGELLFYVASQQRDPRAPGGGSAGGAPGGGGWQVPGEVVEELLGTLGGGRDEVVQVTGSGLAVGHPGWVWISAFDGIGIAMEALEERRRIEVLAGLRPRTFCSCHVFFCSAEALRAAMSWSWGLLEQTACRQKGAYAGASTPYGMHAAEPSILPTIVSGT